MSLLCPAPNQTISIHAPREGGDAPTPCASPAPPYFNPRPPRGGRLAHFRRRSKDQFQSTPPARGATRPVRGLCCVFTDFNPRPPRGGRLCPYCGSDEIGEISIHAPREGGDSKDAQFYLRIFDKQVELLRFLGKNTGWLPEKPGERPAFSREKPCEPPGNLWSLGLRGGREGASRIPVRRTTAAPGGVRQRIRGSSGR